MTKLQEVAQKIIFNKSVSLFYPHCKRIKELRIYPEKCIIDIFKRKKSITKIIIRDKNKYITLTSRTLYLEDGCVTKYNWRNDDE